MQENHEEKLIDWRSLSTATNQSSSFDPQKVSREYVDEREPTDQCPDEMKIELLAPPQRDASSNNNSIESTAHKPGTPETETLREKGTQSRSKRLESKDNSHHLPLLHSCDDAVQNATLSTKVAKSQIKLFPAAWRRSTSTSWQPSKNDRRVHEDHLNSHDGQTSVKRLNFGFLQKQSLKKIPVVKPQDHVCRSGVEEAAQETSPCEENVKSRKVNWASRVAKKGWKNLKAIGVRKRAVGKA